MIADLHFPLQLLKHAANLPRSRGLLEYYSSCHFSSPIAEIVILVS